MPGDIRHHHLVTTPAARAGQLGQHADGHPARRLREDALGAREQAHRVDDLLFSDRLDHAARLERDAVHVDAIGRIADGDRARDGVRPDRQHLLWLVRLEGVVNG